jgi:hypothetical protein
VRWQSVALAGIATAVVAIAAWQIWDSHWQPAAKWLDTDRPDCQVWDPVPQRNETVTWSGMCGAGKAQGAGVATWRYTDRTGQPQTEIFSGPVQDGKPSGHATIRFTDGTGFDGSYQDGVKSGHGIYTGVNGKFDGEWKNGKPNGFGTYTDDEGTYVGQWKDGCLDDKDNVIAFGNSLEECRRILGKD